MHFTSPFKPINELKLLKHQQEAVKWMNHIKYSNTSELSGGILADTMGLGKTFSIMGMISSDRTSGANNLLIVPLAMMSTWIDTLSSYNFSVYRIQSDQMIKVSHGAYNVYIINYHSIIKYFKTFNGIIWDNIIIDEAHNIKNKKSVIYSYIYSLTYKFMWLVTATPIINNIKDIYNLFYLIGYSESVSEFINNYSSISEKYILRRTIEDIPDISGQIATSIIHNINLEMSSNEIQMYNDIINDCSSISKDLLDKINHPLKEDPSHGDTEEDSDTSQDEEEAEKGSGFKMIHKLRLLSMNISMLDSDSYSIMDSNKYQWIYKQLCCVGSREKMGSTIFFSNMNQEILCITSLLLESGVLGGDIYIINGTISAAERSRVLEEMKMRVERGERVYLILQLKSGACGLNLQYFTSVVFFNRWWNQPIIDQAIGRVVRLGSSGSKQIYFLSYGSGYDSLVSSVLLRKSTALPVT